MFHPALRIMVWICITVVFGGPQNSHFWGGNRILRVPPKKTCAVSETLMDFWSGCFLGLPGWQLEKKLSPEEKAAGYVLFNPGCLIGILKMVDHSLHATEDIIPYSLKNKQGPFFHCSIPCKKKTWNKNCCYLLGLCEMPLPIRGQDDDCMFSLPFASVPPGLKTPLKSNSHSWTWLNDRMAWLEYKTKKICCPKNSQSMRWLPPGHYSRRDLTWFMIVRGHLETTLSSGHVNSLTIPKRSRLHPQNCQAVNLSQWHSYHVLFFVWANY